MNDLLNEKLAPNWLDYCTGDDVVYEEDEWREDESLAEYRARCPWMFN